jgi:hypothetical protein
MIYSERIMCCFLKLNLFWKKNILKIERHFFRAPPCAVMVNRLTDRLPPVEVRSVLRTQVIRNPVQSHTRSTGSRSILYKVEGHLWLPDDKLMPQIL